MSGHHHRTQHAGPYAARDPRHAHPGHAGYAGQRPHGPGPAHHDPRAQPRAEGRSQAVRRRASQELAQADRHGLLPIAGGLAIDLVDLATIGPIGLFAGALVGGFVTWSVAKRHGLSTNLTRLMTVIGAVYCTVPFTELLPLATLLAVVSRLLPEPNAAGTPSPALASEPLSVHQAGAPRR